MEFDKTENVDLCDLAYELEIDMEYLASHLKILCNGSAVRMDYVITSEDILYFTSSLYEKVCSSSFKIHKLREMINNL